MHSSPIILQLDVRSWPLKIPFRITGRVFDELDLLVCTLRCDGVQGQGEAAGVYYHGETGASLRAQIEAVRSVIEAGISRAELQELLPAGGARNAVDCALWALPGNSLRLGLPVLDPAGARARGARSLVIGVAPVGGRILPAWVPSLVAALEAGLDVVSGMHTPLSGIPELAAAAERSGRRLIDVRVPPPDLCPWPAACRVQAGAC